MPFYICAVHQCGATLLKKEVLVQMFSCEFCEISKGTFPYRKFPVIPIIAKQPDYLILYVGTNDATTNPSREIIDDLFMLKSDILKQLPNCRVIVSKLTIRIDHGKANLNI